MAHHREWEIDLPPVRLPAAQIAAFVQHGIEEYARLMEPYEERIQAFADEIAAKYRGGDPKAAQ